MSEAKTSIRIAAVGLAAVSGYFSVSGMAAVYAGSKYEVIILFTAIEAGKLVTAAWLYANWHKTDILLRCGLAATVLAAMMLTSGGVFGFLTHAYLSHAPALAAANQQADAQAEIVAELRRRLDQAPVVTAVTATGKTAATAQLAAARMGADERNRLTADYQVAVAKLAELRTRAADQETEIGPARYLADLVGLPATEAVQLLTLIAVLCLDPLAVMLMMASGSVAPARPARKRRKAPQRKPTRPAAPALSIVRKA